MNFWDSCASVRPYYYRLRSQPQWIRTGNWDASPSRSLSASWLRCSRRDGTLYPDSQKRQNTRRLRGNARCGDVHPPQSACPCPDKRLKRRQDRGFAEPCSLAFPVHVFPSCNVASARPSLCPSAYRFPLARGMTKAMGTGQGWTIPAETAVRPSESVNVQPCIV